MCSLEPQPAWLNSSMTVPKRAAVPELAARAMLLRPLFIVTALDGEAVDMDVLAEESAGRRLRDVMS